jgi:hypothetical protein
MDVLYEVSTTTDNVQRELHFSPQPPSETGKATIVVVDTPDWLASHVISRRPGSGMHPKLQLLSLSVVAANEFR